MQVIKSIFVIPRISRAVYAIALIGMLSACVSDGPKVSKQGRPKTDSALAHTKLAQGYLKQKQYAVAKDELEKALKIDPGHSESHYTMALLMLELQQSEDTEKHFIRAVASDSNNSAAAHDFGSYLCQTKRQREALKYFEIAASNPLFDQAYLSLMRAGECLAHIEDPEAEKYLKEALAINSRLGPALFQLASLKYDSEEYLSARAYIQRYFAIKKPQPKSLLLAYKIESSLNASDFADEHRTQLLKNYPASSQAKEIRPAAGDR